MRRNEAGKLIWGITVAALLWFVDLASAIPLESWDNKIPNAGTRFKVLSEFGGQAVLDKETGLVWEQSPSTGTLNWNDARFQCTSLTTGGRKGWRLPSVHELTSLIDPSVTNPALPSGHPFLNVQSSYYWSATTIADRSTFAWAVHFSDGDPNIGYNKSFLGFVWCVRGGMNADQY